jgi:hypothetical protein
MATLENTLFKDPLLFKKKPTESLGYPRIPLVPSH